LTLLLFLAVQACQTSENANLKAQASDVLYPRTPQAAGVGDFEFKLSYAKQASLCKTCFSKRFRQPESVGQNSSFDTQAWAQRGDGWQGRKEKPATVFKQV